MESRSHKAVLVITAIAFAVTWWSISIDAARAQVSKELTPREKRGKEIYLNGEGDGGVILAALGGGDLEVPAGSFPCSNCHGVRGEGSREGGIQPPRLDWRSLSSASESQLTRNSRGAYTETSLARAISLGVDANGARLHPGMPRYKMTAAQMGGLIAYLKKIGEEPDFDPGLSEDSIKVGAALPMSGALSKIGEDIKAALGACFLEINSKGGIYGRRVELLIEDSQGDPAGTLQATRRLVERDNVFALLGSFEPQGSGETNEFLSRNQVPLIGPVTLSPRLPAVPSPYVFYLLPGFSEQARSLVDFVGSERTRPKARPASRIAVVYSESEFDRDALEGLRSQLKIYSMQMVVEHRYEAGAMGSVSAVKHVAANNPDYVFFFGGGNDLERFVGEIDRARVEAGILSSAVMIGRAAFSLPPAVAERTYLSYPFSLPERAELSDFIATMQRGGVSLRSAPFQTVAYAAARVFIEAARNSSRQISRKGLIDSLERLQDYQTGVIGPVTFGANRRIGASGSYIVRIDSTRKQYVAVSERIVPTGGDQ